MRVAGRVIEIETKAGVKFFTNIRNSNFATQSANSLLNVSSVKDYKVFLNPEILNKLTNRDKLKVVDAWVGHPKGILRDPDITTKFSVYWGESIESALDFEAKLRSKNDWFDSIFKQDL